jgi:hypothetical protein
LLTLDRTARVAYYQLGPPQQVFCCLCNLLKACLVDATPGDENRIPSGSDTVLPYRLPEAAFDPVPGYCIPVSFAHDKTEPGAVQVVGQKADHQETVSGTGAFSMDLGKAFAAS